MSVKSELNQKFYSIVQRIIVKIVISKLYSFLYCSVLSLDSKEICHSLTWDPSFT